MKIIDGKPEYSGAMVSSKRCRHNKSFVIVVLVVTSVQQRSIN